ncbi:MAG: LysM peptidoglycan-binding domain-containing protein, partial [Nitrospira sp.]|nr:LysM peptidoglycan-binding domain-containing protein [Nitrospira sp.]
GPSGADHPNSHGQVVIQEGDTLWKLANRYHVSIDQLKDWNHLSSDLIMTGLRLRVVAPDTTQEALSSPDPKLTNVEAPVQAEAKAAPLKNHTPDQQLTTTPGQTETKNLLSVSTPK